MLDGRVGSRIKRVAKRVLRRGEAAPAPVEAAPEPPAPPHGDDILNGFVDVLFINGCDYAVPHPIRYRVTHQADQLESMGISTAVVNAWELLDDHVRCARTFIVFRCPYFEGLDNFVRLAHASNKKVFFDIDDLVIDTKYTDQIPYVAAMGPEDRAVYDDGVRRYGQAMMLCDGVITTTDQLAEELRGYLDLVFVNRNVASQDMVGLSLRALSERDGLALKAEEDVSEAERERWEVAHALREGHRGFTLGFFSGSITHNPDLELITPALLRLMRAHDDVYLQVVGEIEPPADFVGLEDRVTVRPFLPWQDLPDLLANIDVNLAPLEDTIFNRAKSENRWVEAGLVGVPTVASNVGALADAITQGVDGLLCDTADDWYEALERLYADEGLRHELGEAARVECMAHHVTVTSGRALADFIVSQRATNAVFVLFSNQMSGGVIVAMKHAQILREAGWDVGFMSLHTDNEGHWLDVEGERYWVLSGDVGPYRGRLDKMVATMWATVPYTQHYFNAGQSYYLVQNRENEFYPLNTQQFRDATATYGYGPDITHVTISPWCKQWLEEDYGREGVRIAPNGLDLGRFQPVERDWSGKVRILVEGDSESEHKNVDESFRIIERLDPEKYEVWYLSYRGRPKSWYRVDRFFQAVPHDEVARVYQQCHVLLKTSVLESWSYPPLEMMATGGQVVVLANGGNAAYLVDGENALVFERGEDERAAELIERIVADEALRECLRLGGLETVARYDWELVRDQVIALYE